ncbi:MAG: hypothetical protein EPO57_00135 [Chitinophagaceae bacterium]|nr:MAG: hypothetical protein EPO57_00135 [Chitinophagaceae bacterium]
MKKILTLISAIFSLCIFCASSCIKHTIQPVQEVPIGEQTLAATKETFQGRWKLHYSMGGYTGIVRVDYPNTILFFTTTDSLYRWDIGTQTINSPVTYAYEHVYISNYSTYMLNIANPNNRMHALQVAYSKKGDTLILVEPHINPEKYYLTKQ